MTIRLSGLILAIAALLSGCNSNDTMQVASVDSYGKVSVYNMPMKADDGYLRSLPGATPGEWNDGIMPINPDPDPGESMW